MRMTQISQLTDFGLFASRVPRYTSYPTAPHFAKTVGEHEYMDWLHAIPPNSSISLYMHVPFCRRLCWFCACRTQGTSTDAPVIAYAKALLAEIAELRKHLPSGVTLSRLHWGGGTPTIMSPAMITQIAEAIFDLAPLKGEFSVEIDPNEIDAARLDALVGAGMNRASIGVQDFDPEVQAAIGRTQPFYLTRQVAEMIRARGVTSLNVDILYGLPHQNQTRMAESVMQLLSLRPDRVALYGYAHVPWMSRRQQMVPAQAMPNPQERLQLFELAQDLLMDAGYQALGIDHFALPTDGLAKSRDLGQMRRNFQGYTDDTASVLIGLGASSISRFPQGFAQNASRTADYSNAVLDGHFPIHRGHIFSQEDLLRATMIEDLMCNFAVSLGKIKEKFGVLPDLVNTLLAQTAKTFAGMVRLDDAGLTVLPKGRPLVRMMARSFDAYDQAQNQHSAAI